MAGYTAVSENHAKRIALLANNLFSRVLIDHLDLYKKCEKSFELGNTVRVSNNDGSSVTTVDVTEIRNWKTLSFLVSDTVDNVVEETVIELATELAHVVEYLIRTESEKYGDHRDVANFVVSDLFGSVQKPNLQVHIVTEAPVSVADPTGLIAGWVSYQCRFFVARRPANVVAQNVGRAQETI